MSCRQHHGSTDWAAPAAPRRGYALAALLTQHLLPAAHCWHVDSQCNSSFCAGSTWAAPAGQRRQQPRGLRARCWYGAGPHHPGAGTRPPLPGRPAPAGPPAVSCWKPCSMRDASSICTSAHTSECAPMQAPGSTRQSFPAHDIKSVASSLPALGFSLCWASAAPRKGF